MKTAIFPARSGKTLHRFTVQQLADFLGALSRPSASTVSPPASRPGRRGYLLLPPRRPASAWARSRGEGGRTQLGLNVVHQHCLRDATDVDDKVLRAGHPDPVWTAVNRRKARRQGRGADVDELGGSQCRWRWGVATLSKQTCRLCRGRMTAVGAQKTMVAAERNWPGRDSGEP